MSDPVFDGNSSTRIWDHLVTLRDWVLTKVAAVTPTPSAFATAWSQSDGSPLSIGNGELICRRMKVGKQMVVTYYFRRGSTTNLGTGAYVFTLPESANRYQSVSGSGVIARAGTYFPISVVGIGTGAFGLVLTSSGARVSNTAPGSWAVGDEMAWTVVLETGS